MLLQHPWLSELAKPQTITEEDEDDVAAAIEAPSGADAASPTTGESPQPVDPVVDEEVASWVTGILEKKRNGTLGKAAQKPALHAAPLDAVSSPPLNGENKLEAPQAAEAAA